VYVYALPIIQLFIDALADEHPLRAVSWDTMLGLPDVCGKGKNRVNLAFKINHPPKPQKVFSPLHFQLFIDFLRSGYGKAGGGGKEGGGGGSSKGGGGGSGDSSKKERKMHKKGKFNPKPRVTPKQYKLHHRH